MTRRLHTPLTYTVIAMVGLAVVSAAGLVVDDRVLAGAPIWLKPLKFSVSIAVYAATLTWLISLVDRGARTARRLGTVIAVALLAEMVVIVGQVLRGRQSHFNVATPLDSALFSAMGLTIALVWVATAWLGVLVLMQRLDDRATVWALRLALPIALAGIGFGFLMTRPTAAQLETMDDTPPTLVGAHSVGVVDGGAGLPLVNWSTEGGDLRVPHFVGMHALQALPLLALGLLLLSRRIPRLADVRVRTRLLIAAGTGYAGLTALVLWQALRGQSVADPDALTLGAGAGVAVTVLVLSAWALRTRPARTLVEA